jgi:hypothetical protein
VVHALRHGASKEGQKLGTVFSAALGYLLVGILLSLARESLGLGTLTIPSPGFTRFNIPIFASAPLPILAVPAGGFMMLALFAFFQRLSARLLRGNEA